MYRVVRTVVELKPDSGSESSVGAYFIGMNCNRAGGYKTPKHTASVWGRPVGTFRRKCRFILVLCFGG